MAKVCQSAIWSEWPLRRVVDDDDEEEEERLRGRAFPAPARKEGRKEGHATLNALSCPTCRPHLITTTHSLTFTLYWLFLLQVYE